MSETTEDTLKDGEIREGALVGEGWGGGQMIDGTSETEGDSRAPDPVETPGVREDEAVPQPPRLEERNEDGDVPGTGDAAGAAFSDGGKPAPEESEGAVDEAEAARKLIGKLAAEKLTLLRELRESEEEINLYFSHFGPLPTTD